MRYRVVVTARANADAIEAFRWKSERSAQAAARRFAGLEKAIAKLGESPNGTPSPKTSPSGSASPRGG